VNSVKEQREKDMKKTYFSAPIIVGALILAGCAKEAIEEVPAPEEEPVPAVEEVTEMPPVVEEPVPAVEEPAPAETLAVVEEPVMPEAVVEEEEPAETVVMEEPPEEPIVIPQEEYVDIEQEPDGTIHPDSAQYMYMIHPNDYLIRIAYKEYGNPNEWRSIYRWNRLMIGDDPNLIYPYHELSLFKPENEIKDWTYDYTTHVVEPGETLWAIAGEEYGDELGWIVIFWDNEGVIQAAGGMLRAGMELKIRTQLWPEN
jgi:nucleoid-associated protein YgaU